MLRITKVAIGSLLALSAVGGLIAAAAALSKHQRHLRRARYQDHLHNRHELCALENELVNQGCMNKVDAVTRDAVEALRFWRSHHFPAGYAEHQLAVYHQDLSEAGVTCSASKKFLAMIADEEFPGTIPECWLDRGHFNHQDKRCCYADWELRGTKDKPEVDENEAGTTTDEDEEDEGTADEVPPDEDNEEDDEGKDKLDGGDHGDWEHSHHRRPWEHHHHGRWHRGREDKPHGDEDKDKLDGGEHGDWEHSHHRKPWEHHHHHGRWHHGREDKPHGDEDEEERAEGGEAHGGQPGHHGAQWPHEKQREIYKGVRGADHSGGLKEEEQQEDFAFSPDVDEGEDEEDEDEGESWSGAVYEALGAVGGLFGDVIASIMSAVLKYIDAAYEQVSEAFTSTMGSDDVAAMPH